jgi:hypothetical protein
MRGGGECGEPRRGIPLLDFHHFRRQFTLCQFTDDTHLRPLASHWVCCPPSRRTYFIRRSLFLGFAVHMSIRLDSKNPNDTKNCLTSMTLGCRIVMM